MRPFILCLLLVACEGPAGPQGAQGVSGNDGSPGATADAGPQRDSAAPAPWLTGSGIDVAVTALAFEAGAATVSFTLTDGNGVALDPHGKLTAGEVSLGFVLAQLATNADGSPAQYTAYTTTTQTSPITNATATQATTESSGTLTAVDVAAGTYTYRVAAPLSGIDQTLTQTVGALAVRTGDAGEAIARTTFSARPDGGPTETREVVTAGACNGCHRTLEAHGGRWTSPTQCVLCHQPQSSDPDTGNTIDFKVMVHKIHRGSSLPSVVAGTPYQIIGYAQTVSDFSTIVFPQAINNCTACHAGAEADHWRTAPSKAACTSCHDTTSFVAPVPAGMVLHGGGTQPDTAMCNICHPATGGLAGLTDKHLTGLLAPTATTVALAIQSMTNTAPGQTPALTFTALVDGAPADLVGSPLTGITATIAGPTTDYATEWQAKIQGSGAAGTLSVVDATTGTYRYVFPTAIPATATGSYSVALEGYLQPTPADARYATVNPVLTFAVTDATPQPRRSIVSRTNCNGCHQDLSAHGGARKNPDYCVFCHNPAAYDSAGAPRLQGTSNVLADTLDFRHFIHKVHAGDQLSRPYLIGGFPLPSVANPTGTQNNFAADRYPAPLTSCAACHTSKNWTLPMNPSPGQAASTSALMSCSETVASTASYCDSPFWTVASTIQLQPQASACTSCHDSTATAAHAQLNTTAAGVEACATCHGPGTAYDVAAFHGTP